MICARGTPAAITSSPETNAVPRQPKRLAASTTRGVKSPPIAIPLALMLSASARRRRNQATMATPTGR